MLFNNDGTSYKANTQLNHVTNLEYISQNHSFFQIHDFCYDSHISKLTRLLFISDKNI